MEQVKGVSEGFSVEAVDHVAVIRRPTGGR